MDAEAKIRREQGARLRKARLAAGFRSARAAALESDWAESSYRAHEAGTRTIGQDDAELYAKRFRRLGVATSARAILFGGEKLTPVVGYALAGGDGVVFSGGQGPFEDVPAPTGATEKTVAVRIKGTSMGRLLDGWLAFYDDRREPPDESFAGELCICELEDGRVLIKTLRAGRAKGLWHLDSQTEPIILDQRVAWAAKVLEMRPR